MKLEGWLIYDKEQYKKNKWFANEVISACSEFSTVTLILVEKLHFGLINGRMEFIYEGKLLNKPNFAISRTIFPMLSYSLELSGVRVFNNYSVSHVCNDKRLTYSVVARSKIPIMRSLFFDGRFYDTDSIHNFSDYPIIIKTVAGHGGTEVFMVDNRESLQYCLSKIKGKDFVIQDICKTRGVDLRVYVLGGEIIGSVLRSSNELRSNYSLGGRASLYELSKKETDIVNDVIECLPCKPDFVGIDFLLDHNTLIFNEVEDVVGTRMLYDTTDINVAYLFSSYIWSQIKR